MQRGADLCFMRSLTGGRIRFYAGCRFEEVSMKSRMRIFAPQPEVGATADFPSPQHPHRHPPRHWPACATCFNAMLNRTCHSSRASSATISRSLCHTVASMSCFGEATRATVQRRWRYIWSHNLQHLEPGHKRLKTAVRDDFYGADLSDRLG